MKNSCHEVWVDPFRYCSSTAFQSCSFHRKIFQQDFIFSSNSNSLFSSHTLAWLHKHSLIYLVCLFLSYLSHAFVFLMKLVLLFTVCVRYKQGNLQAYITA